VSASGDAAARSVVLAMAMDLELVAFGCVMAPVAVVAAVVSWA